MDVVNVYDVDVCSKGLRYELELLILVPYFTDQVIPLIVHRLEEVLEEFSFVIDPCGLVLDLTDDTVTFSIS